MRYRRCPPMEDKTKAGTECGAPDYMMWSLSLSLLIHPLGERRSLQPLNVIGWGNLPYRGLIVSLQAACEGSSVTFSKCLSARLSWLSSVPPDESVLIDVFSKALLVQSLPVLVFFWEITNCSANPSQSNHLEYLEEPVLRTSPRCDIH